MGESRLEVMYVLTQLWNSGVREVPAEYFDPAVELESPFSSVSGQPYRGHAGVDQWARDVDEQFSEWRTRHEQVHEVGDSVISIGRLHGRGRASEVELDEPYAIVLDFGSDHLVTRVRIYEDVEAARRAVGLVG